MLGRRRDPDDVGHEVLVGITSLVHLRVTVGTLLVGGLVASAFATGRASASCAVPATPERAQTTPQPAPPAAAAGEATP